MQNRKDRELDEASDLVEELMAQNDALRKRLAEVLAEDITPELKPGGLRGAYSTVLALQYRIENEMLPVASNTLLDYRKVKALAATFELQEYLANAIAAAVSSGELEPDPED